MWLSNKPQKHKARPRVPSTNTKTRATPEHMEGSDPTDHKPPNTHNRYSKGINEHNTTDPKARHITTKGSLNTYDQSSYQPHQITRNTGRTSRYITQRVISPGASFRAPSTSARLRTFYSASHDCWVHHDTLVHVSTRESISSKRDKFSGTQYSPPQRANHLHQTLQGCFVAIGAPPSPDAKCRSVLNGWAPKQYSTDPSGTEICKRGGRTMTDLQLTNPGPRFRPHAPPCNRAPPRLMPFWFCFHYRSLIAVSMAANVGKPWCYQCSYGTRPFCLPYEQLPKDSPPFHGSFAGNANSTEWRDKEPSGPPLPHTQNLSLGLKIYCQQMISALVADLTRRRNLQAPPTQQPPSPHSECGDPHPGAHIVTDNYRRQRTATMLISAQEWVLTTGLKGTVIDLTYYHGNSAPCVQTDEYCHLPHHFVRILTWLAQSLRLCSGQSGSTSGHGDRPTAYRKPPLPKAAMECSKCWRAHPRGQGCSHAHQFDNGSS